MVKIKQQIIVFLVLLSLCGFQIVQASPLHDHLNHINDCTLCCSNFDDNEDFIPASANSDWTIGTAPLFQHTQPLTSPCTASSPFQSRAPPHLTY